MKFANLKYTKNRTGSVNIGDDMQIFAISNLYKLMGIGSDSIIKIDFSELSTYEGEYCILPISFPLYGYQNEFNITNFSPYIIPVFLSLSIMAKTLSDVDVNYLKKFEPIGCRDKYTMNVLRRYQIVAYLNGCLTATLPYAENNKRDEIYMVDIPEDYYSFIPEEIKRNAIKVSQIIEHCEDEEKKAAEYFEMYSNHAKFVITSRLHCANPCAAAGIPVILMKEHFSFRFSGLSKHINIYTKDEFDNIDWNPVASRNTYEKQKMIELAKNRIFSVYEQYKDIFEVSYYHESKLKKQEEYIEHYSEVVEFIDSKWNKEADFDYAFWGVTQKSELIYQYVKTHYKNAKLVGVYDNRKTGEWHGIQIEKSSEIEEKSDQFVFVTAATAILPAKQLFASFPDDKRMEWYGSTDDISLLK